MQMVSITGENVRVAHTSGHIVNVGMEPVDVSSDIPGLIEHALACGCMPNERLQAAIAARTPSKKKDKPVLVSEIIEKETDDTLVEG